MEVRDISGRIVREAYGNNGNEFTFNKNGLPSDLYFVKLSGDNVYTTKLIVQ
jgi:hypothetical protein